MPPAAVAGGMDVKQIRIAAKVFNFLQKKPVPGAIVVVLTGAADVALLSAGNCPPTPWGSGGKVVNGW